MRAGVAQPAMSQPVVEDKGSSCLGCRSFAHIPDEPFITEVVGAQAKLGGAVGYVEVNKGNENIDRVTRFLDLVIEMDAILVVHLRFGTRKREECTLVNKDGIITENLSNNGHPGGLIQVGQKVKLRGIKGIELHVETATTTLAEHVKAVGELEEEIPSLDGIHDLVVMLLDGSVASIDLFIGQTIVSGLGNLRCFPWSLRLLLFLDLFLFGGLLFLILDLHFHIIGRMHVNDLAPLSLGRSAIASCDLR